MTREEWKKILDNPMAKAFVEGKKLQRVEGRTWFDVESNNLPIYWLTDDNVLRIKPEPREFWINVYPPCFGPESSFIFNTKLMADSNSNTKRIECIHVREVLD